jgi:hypothetical protein
MFIQDSDLDSIKEIRQLDSFSSRFTAGTRPNSLSVADQGRFGHEESIAFLMPPATSHR